MPKGFQKRPRAFWTLQEALKTPPRHSKIDFSSQHGPSELQKTIKIYWKNNDSEPLHEFNIRSLLYQTLMPTWLHFGVKFPPKMPPRCLQDALGRPSLVPKTAQEPPKRRPRCAKNRPRAAPEASWKRPLGALGRRHAAKHPQTPSRHRFWIILGTIWKDFGIILDGFLERRNSKID